MNEVVGHDEVVARLVALCIGGSAGLPRRERDRQILLAAATLWMERGSVYTEAEVNEGLSRWLVDGCPSLQVDVVTLRRLLVDHLYIDRDDSGRHYSPGAGPSAWRYADDVATVDTISVITEAMRGRETRRAAYRERAGGDR